MGRGRRLAAAASLLGSAGAFVWLGLHYRHSVDLSAPALAFGAGLAAASVGLTRKNLFAQIMSRGLAWVLFAPCAVVTIVEVLKGRLNDPAPVAFALSSGAALLLASPMLRSEEARAAFAPSKFRRSFLAACTSAVTIGLVTGMVAWEMLWWNQPASGVALGALGTSMIASAFGVLRMRGWGIALAALNAIISFVAGALVGAGEGFALAMTAIPGLLFLLPIVLAKLGIGDERAEAARLRVRVTDACANEETPLPARVRIATSNDTHVVDEERVDLQKAERALVVS
jgi:hypothetical protein